MSASPISAPPSDAEQPPSPLLALILKRVALQGPISVADYMDLVLAHPEHGYYRTRDPLGRGGDFTTSPEISQIFGELLGLWSAIVWQSLGSPARIHLVELGPGRGTLMADALRASALLPDFHRALSLHLVETSPTLRALQADKLKDFAPVWHDNFDSLPDDAPLLLLANEFFDALPIRQFLRTASGWAERCVGVKDGKLAFVTGPAIEASDIAALLGEDADAEIAEGSILEDCPTGRALAAALGERLARQGGAALIIDYGTTRPALGDSLQAVRQHAFHPVLEQPGEADVTAHVAFPALLAAAQGFGPVASFGPVAQGTFLMRLGAGQRAMSLAQSSPARAEEIIRACNRLIDPRQMGTLFKVAALTHPDLPPPPGFDESSSEGQDSL